ncbi:uncharacterized protein LOC123869632 [Maniola jurtina]|uniref:uncharacterized protein LOC123869632 n=1 Tax=Maniola jurtina TaxID=191418 RepID=UPI001E68FA17|nr:uncharacterized protein LOC123869632 [Maniola jurtina]
MMPYGIVVMLTTLSLAIYSESKCAQHQSQTFVRWSGMAPDQATPVFVYSASGGEESLTGACLAQCRDLPDCAAVVIAYTKGTCQGVASSDTTEFRADNDVVYFNKVCLKLPENCEKRWWSLESTPGYYLNSEDTHSKVLLNTTVQQCYDAVFSTNEKIYRSAQWIDPRSPIDTFALSDKVVGNCILNIENKFTEPESYRVSNYYTFYIENQCGHDYPRKIDRCSYEEYYNQTIKHVDLTAHNYTKSECKSACEAEKRFVCRGFTWTATSTRGLCDLHSEDLVTTGSWLLRRVSGATYYRRVICLNISVECEGSHLVVTYKPRVLFRGRMYVPGRGDHCSARALTPTSPVRLALPMYGDCDVNFAYAITKGPNGNVNRTMAYVMLMIQNNPIIQTAGDRWVRVGCSPGAGARGYTKVDATVAVQDSGRPSLASEASTAQGANQGASAVFDSNTAPLSMYVVRAHGDAGATAVSLGELLELRIETTEESEIEAYHLVASSRLGDSSVLLLDSRGCPTGQVDFPSFTRSRLGGTQRLSARFKAFRFPTSHVIRFAIMVRFCEEKCLPIICGSMEQLRNARNTNDTYDIPNARIAETFNYDVAWAPQVVAQGGRAECAGGAGRVPLELEMVVGSRDILSADTLVRADHRSALPEEAATQMSESAMVCIHELLLVALVLLWLAVQVLLLIGCCVLVKRYRNLAEMNMQKDYQSFDNVGFDTISTHRRVHWPDQNIDIIHAS